MSKFRFDRKAARFRSRKRALLERMANNAQYEFKVVSFDSRSFNGRAWTPNKIQDGRQQLVKTSRMRDSITILSRTANSIKVGTNVPYAKYHNDGTATLPKRQFIGKNQRVESKNKQLISAYLKGK